MANVRSGNAVRRVLRIKYGSHEKSVMHGHPDGVMVCLTGFRGRFTFPKRKDRGAKRQGRGNPF
jgi:hypothetical protein